MRGNALILQPEIHNKTQNHCMKEYMRYIVTTIGAMMLCLSAWAQDSVSISRADYDALLKRIENIEQREGIKPEGKSAKLRQIGSGEEYQKFRFGGYGEILAQFMNYDPKIIFDGRRTGSLNSTNAVSIPRFVLAGDYRFNKHWNLGVEIEFEAGGVGLEYEMEGGSEGNEHEVEYEKGGNVDLVLSGISNDATKVEVCVLDRLRHRVFTLKQLDITNVSDTAYIQLDNLQDWRMPHADIIKEENIKTFIKDWIDNGAKE